MPAKPLKALTDRQTKFVAEYLIDLNATQAALRAGYSARTAAETGYENLRKPHIAAAISSGKGKQLEKAGIDADYLLHKLHSDITAPLKDLFAPDGSLLAIHDWPDHWQTGIVTGVKVKTTTIPGKDDDDEEITISVAEVKLADRAKRLELLGKHTAVAAFAEAGASAVTNTFIQINSGVSPKEAYDIYKGNKAMPMEVVDEQ